MSNDDSDIIFQLQNYVLSYCQKKTLDSLDEIYKHLYPHIKLDKNQISMRRLKMTLRKLEEKQAVIFVDGFNSVSSVERKLSELVDVSKSDQI